MRHLWHGPPCIQLNAGCSCSNAANYECRKSYAKVRAASEILEVVEAGGALVAAAGDGAAAAAPAAPAAPAAGGGAQERVEAEGGGAGQGGGGMLVTDLVSRALKLTKPAPAPRDQWTPNSAATACEVCAKGFGMLRRKHHCRQCGKLVCKACLPRTTELRYS